MKKSKSRLTRTLGPLLSSLVGAGLLLWLFSRVSMDDLTSAAQQAIPEYLILAFFLSLSTTPIRALRFATFFRPRGQAWLMYGVFALGRVVNASLPFRSGEMVFMALLKGYGLVPTVAHALPVWLTVKLGDLVGFGAWLAIGVFLLGTSQEIHSVFGGLVLVGSGAIVALIFAAIWVNRGGGARFPAWIKGRMEAMRAGFQLLRKVSTLGVAFALSVLIWGGMLWAATINQQAFQSPLGISEAFLLALMIQAVYMLPIHAPFGLGTADAAWFGGMNAFGVPPEQAAIVTICLRVAVMVVFGLEWIIGMSLTRLFGHKKRR